MFARRLEHFSHRHSGNAILQIAAGTNVLPKALALDIEAKDGFTAVFVKTTESYATMTWFANRKFHRVIVISALNKPKTNKDYSWIFENARFVLKNGGTLELNAPESEGHPHDSLVYVRNNLESIKNLGYALLGSLNERQKNSDITRMDSETNDPDIARARPDLAGYGTIRQPGETFPIPRAMFSSRVYDTVIRFRYM